MPGPSDTPPSESVLEVVTGRQPEPVTASTIASDTDHSIQTVQDELEALVEESRLRTKEIEGTRVWWPLHDDQYDAHTTAATADQDTQQPRQGLVEQHRQLAQFVTRVEITDDLDEILRLVTEEARDLVGAHQSVTSRTINQNWEQAINAVSLSEKYAEYRDYDTRPDGCGIYSLVCERNEPMRLTQAELEAHPAWEAFGDDADEHPPMRGWLAVPIVGPEGQNRGLIQLSDKYQGTFTEADEAILLQLANVASAAIENARLYADRQESEERYRTLFDAMAEGYCVLEAVDTGGDGPRDFRYVEANPAFAADTTRSDVTGATVREVGPGNPEGWLTELATVLETGDEVTFERNLEADGRVVRCHAFPVGNVPTDRVGLTVQDITERVVSEQALEASNERLEQFAHAASHDLQEPLRMVSSYLQLIEQRYGDDLDEDGREFLAFAVDGADRMRDMIDALLQYSRVDTRGAPFAPVDLGAIVDDVRADLQMKIDDANAEITVADLPTVQGDRDQLRQVVQNLLKNAIEYCGDAPPRIRISAARRGDRWVVSISDDGIGIDPDDQDRIFQVFERLHTRDEHDGTGIGLALCRRIVERHDGDIRVNSTPGEGATFSFTLSARDQQ